MKNNNAFAGVVYWLATVAATGTLVTHVAQWSRNGNETKPEATAAQNLVQTSEAKTDVKLSAPYRDGVYLAKLSQQRGEQRTPSIGRWATTEQRGAFSAGYGQVAEQVAQAHEETK
ncbi:MAG: hypothetical protein M3P45_04180 [Acidobacteriota bacterium]|nr:hypothetical protein [Acidobacteriota bacterium]